MANTKRRKDGRIRRTMRHTDPLTGESKKHDVYGKTQREAAQKLKEARARIDAGAPVKDSSRTLAEWSKQWRETSLQASDRRPSSKVTSDSLLRLHVEAENVGKVRLDRLGVADLERLVLALRAKPLKESTISRVFQVLKKALDDAVAHGLLARNPVTLMTRKPKADTAEARFLSRTEVTVLINAAEGTRYARSLQFIAKTGLRKGELIGLRWADVDLKSGSPSFTVNRTVSRFGGKVQIGPVKTGAARRTIGLSEPLVALLKAQRKAQVAERLKAGTAWSEGDYVFATATGQPMDPRNVLRAVTTAAGKAGLAGVTVHTLRHSALTALAERGKNPKVVQMIAGHADVSTTLKIYTHVSDDMHRDAMDALSAAFDF